MLETPESAVPDGPDSPPRTGTASLEPDRRRLWRPAARWGELRSAAFVQGLRAALPAWIAARVLVCGVSWFLYPRDPLNGLHMWDTKWYTVIEAEGGYRFRNLVHFFPLTPLVAHYAVLALFLSPTANTLIAFCWIVALPYGATVYVLTLREIGDRAAARRAAWLTQLIPGGFAQVMGYTEPLAGLLAAGYFLAVRTPSLRRLSPAGAATVTGTAAATATHRATAIAAIAAPTLGFLCGLARPTGALIAIAGLAEGAREVRRAPHRARATAKALLTTIAPVAGLGSWLLYCQVRFHGWTLPFDEQLASHNRGAIMNDPLSTFTTMLHWSIQHQFVAYIAAILTLLAVALLPALAWRLPVSYIAWTAPLLVLAAGSNAFTSIARYVGELFPLGMAAAIAARRRWQAAALLAVCTVLLVVTTYQAFSGQTVA
jgi:hypothetical protein